ncbi:hypothetical protein BDW02DRAFT_564128 [Decorospora gaudefroyi]|uniref:Uncharacterized protein n=1 Tax=Decorospora gaudefroyi TaxID=184978 RepID=A0A6A5KWS2_9PLEO|nr:hypothetical protein BDW02DRAFT_564128 [Decorospora gaudefroyi]
MAVVSTTPSPTPSTAPTIIVSDSSNLTVIFGVFGLLVAVIGIAIGVLQLRHMTRRRMKLEVFELP